MATAVSSPLRISLPFAANPKSVYRKFLLPTALTSRAESVALSNLSDLKTRQSPSPMLEFLPTTLKHEAEVFDESVVDPRGLSDFIDQSRELIRHDFGPPRWISPIDCSSSRHTDLPLLFYLPGIDGTGMGLVKHHQRLGKIFEVWCLHIPVMDRTPFKGLVEYVEKTIKSENTYFPNKPIYLVGESLGACIALAVAARNPNIDFVLILANPATCFSKSKLQFYSYFLDIFPEPMHVAFPYFLDFLAGDFLTAFLFDILNIWKIYAKTMNERTCVCTITPYHSRATNVLFIHILKLFKYMEPYLLTRGVNNDR